MYIVKISIQFNSNKIEYRFTQKDIRDRTDAVYVLVEMLGSREHDE